MRAASSNPRSQSRLAPQGDKRPGALPGAPPGLLRCLLVSASKDRAELLRSAAEKTAWEAAVCNSTEQFLRELFKLKVPLTIIDLPVTGSSAYPAFREATGRVGEINDALVVVCGANGHGSNGAGAEEESWARQLGVWAYLPCAEASDGLEMVFGQARQALAKQATGYLDSSGQWK